MSRWTNTKRMMLWEYMRTPEWRRQVERLRAGAAAPSPWAVSRATPGRYRLIAHEGDEAGT